MLDVDLIKRHSQGVGHRRPRWWSTPGLTSSSRQIRSTLGRSRRVPRPSLVACGAGSGGRVRCWRCAVVRWAGSPALAVQAALAGQADGGQVGKPGCRSAPALPGRCRVLPAAGASSAAPAAGHCAPARAAAAGRRDRRSGRLRPGHPASGRVRVAGAACDDQVSWPTAAGAAPDLACVIADGYSVSPWIDGKEKVYGSIP